MVRTLGVQEFFENQQQEGRQYKQIEMLFVYLDFSALKGLSLCFLLDTVKIQDVQIQVTGSGADISTACFQGDIL